MGRRHTRHAPDAEGWTEWVQPIEQGYHMSCCDCGLVHEFDFRIEAGRVQFRARRHTRATAQVRRHMKPAVDR